MPPQPSDAVQERDGTPLFDLFSMERRWLPRGGRPTTRLTYEQALGLAQYIARSEGAIILRYYCEPVPPPGKDFDSLEWLNPDYVPWQERRGFYFGKVGGGYFETTNVVELQGTFGQETVPAELYLVTIYRPERADLAEEERSVRPFGQRQEAIVWLQTIAHKKAGWRDTCRTEAKLRGYGIAKTSNSTRRPLSRGGQTEWLD